MNEILKNIEKIRKERGLKQAVIAEKLGVKQNTYSQYINGNDDIWLSRLSKIADILNVSIIDIITYPDKYVPENDLKVCTSCKEKDDIIRNLNNYIKLLEGKNNKNQ